MLHARKDYMPIQDPREGGIPHDEPVMLFRAQDDLFVDVLEYYRSRVAEQNPTDPALPLLDNHIKLGKAWPTRKRMDIPEKVIADSLPKDVPEDPIPDNVA